MNIFMNKELLKKTFLLLILSRISIIVFVYIFNLVHGKYFVFYDLLCQWDCGWYNGIIDGGYHLEPQAHDQQNAASWAFFPLYPISIRILKTIFPLSNNLLGFLCSTIYIYIASIYLYKLVQQLFDSKVANNALFFIFFGPYMFYYSTLMTESLYIMLCSMFFYFAFNKKYIQAGCVGAFLTATRITGILVIPSLLLMMYFELKKNNSFKTFITNPIYILSILIVPLGLFLYMSYLYYLTGDAFAFMHIQIAWVREFQNPIQTLITGITGRGFPFGGKVGVYITSYALMSIIIGILFVRKNIHMAVFILLNSIVLLSTTSNQSCPRVVMSNIMAIIGLSFYLSRINNIFIAISIKAVLIIFSILTLNWWLLGRGWLA